MPMPVSLKPDEVDYFETVEGIIGLVEDAYSSGEFESLKDLLLR